jgi:hypothetical protein
MKRNQIVVGGLILFAAFVVAGFSRSAVKITEPFAKMATHPPSAGFAVVELFTSEGCSSCPPADKVIAQIAGAYPGQVYVLGFHVDYWNRLGWKDIYSAAGYTQRQQGYAALFHLQSIYTPEAVVNGRKEFVGSDQDRLQSAIKEELAATANHPFTLTTSAGAGRTITVTYKVDIADPGASLQIVLLQSHASSQVLKGENQGLHLEHINVVRDFRSIPIRTGIGGRIVMTAPDGVSAKDCKVIAFLQDKEGPITGVSLAGIE